MVHLSKHVAFPAIIAMMILSESVSSTERHPCWLWKSNHETAHASVRFVKVFNTQATTFSAQLRYAAESAHLTIQLDGNVIADAEPYDPIQSVEIENRLQPGDHEIVVAAPAVKGPSAFFLQLDLKFEDATHESIVSDSSWRMVDAQPVKNLGPVDRRLVVPESRRVGINVVDNYEQWKQALGAKSGPDPASFLVAPGFEIQLVRSAMPDEDSWVSLVFDPQGRVIIAKEQKGLLRMTLSDDGGKVTKVESIDDTLEECRGLAFIGSDLYVNANNSKGLYRLPHAGERFAEPELLYGSTGGVGHGRNDLAVGPDGKLYAIHGDAVDLPTDTIDYTSPYRDARRGEKTSEGHLLRIDPKSGTVEVLAAGLRNPFGIDFNDNGEVFTYDADAEYDMGSPWYRPTRVNHLVTGGDYGWRGVTKSWPPYYPDHPDNARPNLDIGKGSPTAVKFGTRSNFPTPYREALFILDWAYGRIIAVHMIPRGSSYLMTAETFVKGRPLNVTDLDFARDGSMFVVTGGRKTQSALYRIRHVGNPCTKQESAQPETTTTHQNAREQFARASRRLRHQLAADLRQPPSKDRVAHAWKYLSDSDPWIRQAAVNVIERHPTTMWQSRALAEIESTSAVNSLTALARSGQRELYPAILRRLNVILPNVESPTDKLTAFYAYWLCLQAMDAVDSELQSAVLAKLGAEYPSHADANSDYSHNRLLSEMLVRLGSSEVVSKTIQLLNTTADQTEQMHYLWVLRTVRNGWTMNDRRAFFSGLAQGKHYLGGAGMSEFLKKIFDESRATLTDQEREQLGSLIEDTSIDEAVNTKPRSVVRKWTVAELLSAKDDQHHQDRERGADVFAAASCIQCHRFGARGTLIGPDLTSVSRRFSRRDLLTSIIEPSKVIADTYRSMQVTTTDGKTYIGQATLGGDYRAPVLRLATDPMHPFKTVEIPKAEIELQRDSDVSWMPTGLCDTFTKGEILDLIEYLESAP